MDAQHLASSASLPANSTSQPSNSTYPATTSFRSAKKALTTQTVINSIKDLQAFVAKAENSIQRPNPLPQNSSPGQTKTTNQQRSTANRDKNGGCCLNMCDAGSVDRQSTSGNAADDEDEKKKEDLRDQAKKLKRELNYLDQATRMKLKMNTMVKFDFKDPELQLKFLELAPSANESFHVNSENNVNANDNSNVNDGVSGGDNELSLEDINEGFEVIGKTSSHLKELMRTILKENDTNKNDDESESGSWFEATYIVSGKRKTFLKEGVLKTSTFIEVMMDFRGAFEELDGQEKLCLLSLSVFPANAIITKKVLFYWWMGEMILQTSDNEGQVNRILKKLVEKEFVEPVIKKRRLIGFKMDPLVRLVVVNLAEAAGFSKFDDIAVPTEDMSSSYKTFLVKTEKGYSRDELQKDKKYDDSHLEKIRTLFNVNDPYPDFEQDKFSKMKNVNVLYLGRWQEAAKYSGRTHHIEIENIEFLKGLKNMKHLIFLSFRGISRISNLPGSNALSNLTDLSVLDFSACNNLESLPDLSFLKKLTHLDLSECHLLDHIPKGISSLLELRVLKGFLVGDSADSSHSSTLPDLVGMKNLRKLSIKSSRDNFPTEQELSYLKCLNALVKLTITWGCKSSQEKRKGSNVDKSSSKSGQREWGVKGHDKKKGKAVTANQGNDLSEAAQRKAAARARWKKAFRLLKGILVMKSAIYLINLQKLELRCFPGNASPYWLNFIAAKRLKKLYISGGNLRELGIIDRQPVRWGIKILRLRFLHELKMDWRELRDRFPNLVYLEKVKCPNLAFFPCDKSGVWLKKDTDLKMDLGLSWSFLTRKSFETLEERN